MRRVQRGLDSSASSIAVRTRAVGLLARLAHDLEISAGRFDGEVNDEGGAWTARLVIPVDSLRVSGVVRGDRVEQGALSPNDQAEILHRMRDDAFLGAAEIIVTASGASRGRADVTVTVGAKAARASTPLTVRERDGGGLDVSGRCVLSLRALGARDIKGPLGAFQLKDEVAVLFQLTLS